MISIIDQFIPSTTFQLETPTVLSLETNQELAIFPEPFSFLWSLFRLTVVVHYLLPLWLSNPGILELSACLAPGVCLCLLLPSTVCLGALFCLISLVILYRRVFISCEVILRGSGLIVSFCLGLALCPEVQSLLEGCELPDLPAGLLLPEDMALRNLPPLRTAHRRFNFDADRPLLSALEEVQNLLPPTSAKCSSYVAAKQGFLAGAGHPPADGSVLRFTCRFTMTGVFPNMCCYWCFLFISPPCAEYGES